MHWQKVSEMTSHFDQKCILRYDKYKTYSLSFDTWLVQYVPKNLPCIKRQWPCFIYSLHFTTLHYTTLHYTTTHYTTLHLTRLYYKPVQYTTLHYTTYHYTALHPTTVDYTRQRRTTLHYTTPHYTTLHYTTLHHTTPHNITLTISALVSIIIPWACTGVARSWNLRARRNTCS